MKVRLPLFATLKELEKLLGKLYHRSHIDRLRDPENNTDPFPEPTKRCPGVRTSKNFYYVPAVIDWLRRRGFPLPEIIEYGLV
jgi:hypothetical protein